MKYHLSNHIIVSQIFQKHFFFCWCNNVELSKITHHFSRILFKNGLSHFYPDKTCHVIFSQIKNFQKYTDDKQIAYWVYMHVQFSKSTLNLPSNTPKFLLKLQIHNLDQICLTTWLKHKIHLKISFWVDQAICLCVLKIWRWFVLVCLKYEGNQGIDFFSSFLPPFPQCIYYWFSTSL